MIAIIDYKAGNLTSVKRALDSLGQDSVITSDFKQIVEADSVIFPGVGAAGTAVNDLKAGRLDMALKEVFEVKSRFPRIVELPGGVGDISYTITIADCSDFALKIDKAINIFIGR